MLRRCLQIGLMLAISVGTLSAGEIIERVVATVNNRPILQSDWDEEVRYEAFVNRRPLVSLTAADRKAALERLIDQELLRQQIKQNEEQDELTTSTQQVAKRLQEIRHQYPGAENQASWQADLRRYRLSEQDLTRHIALQVSLERLIDVRLRPTIHISHSSIEAYYKEQLLPELRKSGFKDVPLVEVSPRIEELLTQRRMNELLSSWLHDLRSQSDIRMGSAGAAGVSPR
ncbi:MAG TPA: SurA N-terminal domain-containing protein [Terriglobales bacterium]|nr:SurA N-terminal domain-containing protein [Terriglobales bacterium]